ncbi:MAG: hypothetical protein IPM29_26575 [Planctomycetes bacterium]|nr:hypothetical protein [Planctomycetota bacterium]
MNALSPTGLGLAVLWGLVVPVARAQTGFVVPSKATLAAPGAVWPDRSDQSGPFFGSTLSGWVSRTQYLYDANDVPVASALLNACSVRSEHQYANVASTYRTTILVSQGPLTPDAASATFATNHGANPTTVFTGSVSLPATTVGGWPAAWQAPIPFASPVPFSRAAGGSLVVDFQTTVTNLRSWYLEGYRIEGGMASQEFVQYACRTSTGNTSGNFSWNTEQLVPGGVLSFSFAGYPQNMPSLAINGLFFSRTGLGSSVFGMTTPFPLASLGLPASPNCQWAIELIGEGWPLTYDAGSGRLTVPGTPVPNDPGLAGATLYMQNVATDTDPVSGAVSIFPSLAVRLTIGTGIRPAATRVSSESPSLPPIGAVRLGNAATLRLHY